MSLSAMGMETGIESQDPLACELPVETDVKEDKAWYKVVGDVLVGITEGVAKAVTDIFTGLYDLLKNLFTDPIGFFGGLATAIMNPIDTATQMWGAVEVAWERDVVNGDARSRASFFSYTVVSVVGLKGVDNLDKAGKVGHATSKADTTLPYNAMKTDKLKETVKANVYATVQQKNQQATNFWKSNFSKEAINKTIEATKNSVVITKAKNTLESTNMKTAVAKTYEDVVKTPIAKTQAAWEKKKEQLLDMPLPNLGLSPVPLGPTTNMTVREGIEAAQNTVMQMVGNKDGGGERTEDRTILEIKGASQYFSYINEIGKRDDLTTEEKLIKIHEAYSALEQKGDVTVVSDMKFLKPEGFGANGRMIVDWPPKMGFVEESIQSINRNNPLPKNWDRVGGKGGENFTTLPDNNIPYSYDERAIPYLENLSARHVGMFKNESYFDAIDALRNDDFEELNRIATMNEKGQISFAEFLDFKAHYEDFLKNIERSMGDVDATYGLKGKASPWINSLTGERLMEGGAEQIVTPLSAEMLEIIGVIPKY